MAALHMGRKLTRLLTYEDCRRILSMTLAIPAIERAFRTRESAICPKPSKLCITLPEYHDTHCASPTFLEGYTSCIWGNTHPGDPHEIGSPRKMSLLVLSDPTTSFHAAVMDATFLSAYRFGATAGVASKVFARKTKRTLGIIGCGAEAVPVLEAHREVFGSLDLLCADPKQHRAKSFAAKHGGRCATIEVVARESDVLNTLLPSSSPIVLRDWIRKGTHINAMGDTQTEINTLDSRILADGKVFLDSMESHGASSTIAVGELGAVLSGTTPGRENEDEITVFSPLGQNPSVLDTSLATDLYRMAIDHGVGSDIQFVP